METRPCEGLDVLVIDDEPIVGKTLQVALGKIGCSVETATDPALALRRLEEKTFDIVLTDVVMGEIDGIQILEAVRERSPRTRVIIMTAFAMMEIARKAMDRGAFDFIAKPFDATEIREIVDRAAAALRAGEDPA